MNNYNPTIGYSSLTDINTEKATDTASYGKQIIESKFPSFKINNIFIAGCGDGTEAILIQKLFNKYVYGVDISLENEIDEPYKITLKKGDLMNLSLPNKNFDFIYSYHVLEHVPKPAIVLQSLANILTKDGIVFIGFPNKNRMFGYIGTHNNATIIDKIKWNLKDYKDRLLGRFENKLGAHAGFSNSEFYQIAKGEFNTIIPVKNDYMLLKYKKQRKIIQLIIKLGLNDLLFPSNYYILKK